MDELVEVAAETALVEHEGNGLEEAVDLLLEARSDIELSGASLSTPPGVDLRKALIQATAFQHDQGAGPHWNAAQRSCRSQFL